MYYLKILILDSRFAAHVYLAASGLAAPEGDSGRLRAGLGAGRHRWKAGAAGAESHTFGDFPPTADSGRIASPPGGPSCDLCGPVKNAGRRKSQIARFQPECFRAFHRAGAG